MTWQFSSRQTFALLFLSASLIGGCNTVDFREADASRYAGYECEELDLLSESYRRDTQEQIFADVSDLERRNEGNRNLGVRDDARPYELDIDRERRSIALARREKGC